MSAERRTRWGWHQLSDDWARRLVTTAGIRPGDLVLEVGAGTGVVTAHLVGSGARVVAVELHPRRAHQLRSRFDPRAVTVLQVDAADLRLPRQRFHVVANPPFGIVTALLRRLLTPGSRLVTADLVLPRHAAERWSGLRAPGVNRWSYTFAIHIVTSLPRTAFRPPARAGAFVVRIERRGVTGS